MKKTPKTKIARPASAVAVPAPPLFPQLDGAAVRGIRCEVLLTDEDSFQVEGALPPDTTRAQLRAFLKDGIEAQEIDGVTKVKGRLDVEITAFGLVDGKPHDLASHEITLTSTGDGETPEPTPPTAPDAPPATAPPVARTVVASPLPVGKRAVRAPREHVIIPEGSTVLPADVTGDHAMVALDRRAASSFAATIATEAMRAMADGSKMMFAAHADGIRKMHAREIERDPIITGLRLDVATEKAERQVDRATYLSKNNELENDLRELKREHKREIHKLEDDIDDRDEKIEKLEKQVKDAQETIDGFLVGFAKEYGPGLVGQFLEKVGIKLPSALTAGNGTAKA